MSFALKGVLGLMLAGEIWFSFGQHDSAAYLERRFLDIADGRPARSVLIVGNSRTYYHRMPQMIRLIADADGSPIKYEIEVDAPPGSTFESLWHDRRTQGLLRQSWDEAVFQGESRGQSTPALIASFQAFGDKLLRTAHVAGGAPRLIVNWTYDPELYEGDDYGAARSAHMHRIAREHGRLARRTGARPIDVQKLWERVRLRNPGIPLTEDGNHPTVAGSYLTALAIYADLSGRTVSRIAYAPPEITAAQAAVLRRSVDQYRLTGQALPEQR